MIEPSLFHAIQPTPLNDRWQGNPVAPFCPDRPGYPVRDLDEKVAGIKVDRKTVLIKLLQSGHPLAKGAVACTASTGLAALILLLAEAIIMSLYGSNKPVY